MNKSIYPCLVVKGKIAEAAEFYINAFGDGKVTQKIPIVIQIELSGQQFMLLNDGPSSYPNPSISFMVMCKSVEETDAYWNKLLPGGNVLMALDTYDWSPRYGWIQDKYGVSWQLYTSNGTNNTTQKFCPTLMFTGSDAGKAAEAVEYYTGVFPDSAIEGILKYSDNDQDKPGLVKHAQFTIKNSTAMAMDSSADHGFGFNDAISLVVPCDNQEEIDKYWNKLTTEGGREVACGWLTDKYGISWQIIPRGIVKLITDPVKGHRAMQAMMKMKKLIIEDLENA